MLSTDPQVLLTALYALARTSPPIPGDPDYSALLRRTDAFSQLSRVTRDFRTPKVRRDAKAPSNHSRKFRASA